MSPGSFLPPCWRYAPCTRTATRRCRSFRPTRVSPPTRRNSLCGGLKVRWFDDRTYRATSDRTASRSQEIIRGAGVLLPEGPEVLLAAAAGVEIEQCGGLLVSVALPAPLARRCSRRFQSWRFDRSRYCIRREWGAYFNSLSCFRAKQLGAVQQQLSYHCHAPFELPRQQADWVPAQLTLDLMLAPTRMGCRPHTTSLGTV